MGNTTKDLIIRNTQTNKTSKIAKTFYNSFKSKPENHFWIKEGFEVPENTVNCWYVSEFEKNFCIINKKQFCDFETDKYFLQTNRIDNIFIEGCIGDKNCELSFISDKMKNIDFIIEFNNRKSIFLTFDRISLYQLIEIIPVDPLKFIMKRIDYLKSYKKNQAFMIMPFHNKELDKFYFNFIKPILKEKLNIEIYRADDFRDNDIIIQTIYNLIEESEFIIADTTFENKNSFYELGYASAIGKEIITIQNKNTEQKLFFDRAHIRAILYNPNEIETFKFDLESTIKSIRDRQ